MEAGAPASIFDIIVVKCFEVHQGFQTYVEGVLENLGDIAYLHDLWTYLYALEQNSLRDPDRTTYLYTAFSSKLCQTPT